MSNREVETARYLPDFVRQYKEIKIITGSQDVELTGLFREVDLLYGNQFILTADEYGIKRVERLLNIKCKKDETLGQRRQRALTRWQADIPYTYRWLDEKLLELYGAGRYELLEDFVNYRLEVILRSPIRGEVEELIYTLQNFVPVNIVNVIRKENGLGHNLYVGNIIMANKHRVVARQNLIANARNNIWVAAVIRTVKNVKVMAGV